MTTAPSPPAPLFSVPIPIIGVTGEYSSGKTLFGLTIAPGLETRVYDTEISSATHLGQAASSSDQYRVLSFDRIDVPAEMQQRHPRGGHKPIDTFIWWREHVLAVPAGQFQVIFLDVANDIETGAVDWVRANPQHFGRTAAQYIKMSGLMWGDMKELWKGLLVDIASRCEVFAFAVHMGDVWAGDKPTGKRKPRGKSTLMELASLFLQLERPKDSRGNIQKAPSAIVLKDRLSRTLIDVSTGEISTTPYLPPRLPVATPAAIRQYLAAPPDYAKLKIAERAQDHVVSDDDRAAVRLATAEAETEGERLKLEREERQRQAAERRTQGQAVWHASTSKPSPQLDRSPEPHPLSNHAPAPPSPADPAPTFIPSKVTTQQLEQLTSLRSEVFGLMGLNGHNDKVKEAWLAILAKRSVTTARDLTEAQAGDLIASLKARAETLHAQRREAPADEAASRF